MPSTTAPTARRCIDQLNDLNTTLTAADTDKIAAAFRLLDFQRNPVGTGPYKFVKYTAGQSVELAKNPDYHGAEVGPANVFIPIIKDAATASAALQKGDINWQTEVTSDALTTLVADPNLPGRRVPGLRLLLHRASTCARVASTAT